MFYFSVKILILLKLLNQTNLIINGYKNQENLDGGNNSCNEPKRRLWKDNNCCQPCYRIGFDGKGRACCRYGSTGKYNNQLWNKQDRNKKYCLFSTCKRLQRAEGNNTNKGWKSFHTSKQHWFKWNRSGIIPKRKLSYSFEKSAWAYQRNIRLHNHRPASIIRSNHYQLINSCR